MQIQGKGRSTSPAGPPAGRPSPSPSGRGGTGGAGRSGLSQSPQHFHGGRASSPSGYTPGGSYGTGSTLGGRRQGGAMGMGMGMGGSSTTPRALSFGGSSLGAGGQGQLSSPGQNSSPLSMSMGTGGGMMMAGGQGGRYSPVTTPVKQQRPGSRPGTPGSKYGYNPVTPSRHSVASTPGRRSSASVTPRKQRTDTISIAQLGTPYSPVAAQNAFPVLERLRTDRALLRTLLTSTNLIIIVLVLLALAINAGLTVVWRHRLEAANDLPFFTSFYNYTVLTLVCATMMVVQSWLTTRKKRLGPVTSPASSRMQQVLPWRRALLAGLVFGLAEVTRLNGAAFHDSAADEALADLLNQSIICFTFVFSAIILRRAQPYALPQMLGVLVVTIGGAIAPIVQVAYASDALTVEYGAILQDIAANVLFALFAVMIQQMLQDSARRRISHLKIISLAMVGATVGVLVFWIASRYLPYPNTEYQGWAGFVLEMQQGWQCLFGMAGCPMEGDTWWVYLVLPVLTLMWVFAAVQVIRRSSAMLIILVGTIGAPLIDLIMVEAQPGRGAPAGPDGGDAVQVVPFQALGVVLSLMGIFMFVLFRSRILSYFVLFFGTCFIFALLTHPLFESNNELPSATNDIFLFYGGILLLCFGLYGNLASPHSRLYVVRRRLGALFQFVYWGEVALVVFYFTITALWCWHWCRMLDNEGLELAARVAGHVNEINIGLIMLPSVRNSIWQVFGVPYERSIRYHIYLGYMLTFTIFVHFVLWIVLFGVQGWSGVCAVLPVPISFPDCSLRADQCTPCSWVDGQWTPADGSGLRPEDITAPVSLLENIVTASGLYASTRGNYSLPFAEISFLILLSFLVFYNCIGSSQRTYRRRTAALSATETTNNSSNNNNNNSNNNSTSSSKSSSKMLQSMRQGLPWYRRYSTFYKEHLLFLVFLAFALMHDWMSAHTTVIGPLLRYCIFGFGMWVVDQCVRIFRGLKRVQMVSFRHEQVEVTRLEMHRPNFTFDAGQYMFLKIPEISHWQWHPFSISSSTTAQSTSFTVHVKDMGPGTWTRELRRLVKQKHKNGESDLTVYAEGPYGHAGLSYSDYEVLVLICGGIGITAVISILLDIYHSTIDLPANERAKKVYLVWAVRSKQCLLWFQDEIEEVSMSDMFEVRLHVTKTPRMGMSVTAGLLDNEDTPGSSNLIAPAGSGITYGRPDIGALFREILKSSLTWHRNRVGVLVCGPKTMSNAVLKECHMYNKSNLLGVRFDCHVEQYFFA